MSTRSSRARSRSLRAAHRALEAALEELRATPPTEGPRASRVFAATARKLREHLTVEEGEVLPRYEAAAAGHRRVGERAREEHRRMRDVLLRIEGRFEQGAERSGDLESELVYLLWSHVSREEEEIFPWLDGPASPPPDGPDPSPRRRPRASRE